MKFARPIKFFQAGCVAAAIGFGTMSAEAQTNAFTFPPIGTVQKVTDYAVAHANVIGLEVFVWNTNGSWKAYFGGVWYASATNYVINKTQMDQQIIATQITNVISQILTNTDSSINKSKGVLIDANCSFNANGHTSYQNLTAYEVIPLPKNPDGSYGIPDLSSFSTTLADSISFYVPNLQWARVEAGYNGDEYPFQIDGNQFDRSEERR